MGNARETALKTIVYGAGISIIGKLVTNVVGLLYKVVTANMLGPEGYGVLSQGIMIFSMSATLVMLGLPQGVERFVSMYRSENDEQKERGTIRTAFELSLMTSLIGASILYFGADVISKYAFNDPNVAIVIKVLAFALPMRAVMAVSLNTCLAYKKIEYKIYARNITEGVVKILATAILLYAGYGLFGASLGMLIGWLAASTVALLLMEIKVRSVLRERGPIDRPLSELVSFSTPLIFSSVFGQITSWADVFLVGFFLSSAAVGQYNVALPTAMMSGMVAGAIASLAIPAMTELYADNKKSQFKRVYKTSTKWILLFVFPATLLMVFFAEQGISFLYGREFIQETIMVAGISLSETGAALRLLAVGYMLFAFTAMSRQAIQSIGETQYTLGISGIVGISNIVLNALFIPLLGIIGAALATTLSWIIGATSSIWFLYREGHGHPFSFRMLPLLPASLLGTLIPYLIGQIVFDVVPEWYIFPAFVLFLVSYVILIFFFGAIDEDDAMILNAIEDKVGMEIPFLHDYVMEVAADDDEA